MVLAIAADRAALLAAACSRDGPRHRRGAHGPLCGGADRLRVERINAITFGIGALMAGAAGALLSIMFPISPLISGVFLGKAFVICVLGGLGSVPGALVGGLALGLLESFGACWFGSGARCDDFVADDPGPGVVRPSGLVGGGATNETPGARSCSPRCPASGRALAASPPTTICCAATTLAMYAVLCLAWNFVGGLAGYPSFATAAFFGLGAYAAASCRTRRADARRVARGLAALRVSPPSSEALSWAFAGTTSPSPASIVAEMLREIEQRDADLPAAA